MTRFFILVALLGPALAPAQQTKPEIPRITNMAELSSSLGLGKFKGTKFKRRLKIAILDNGFSGHDTQIGVTLPRETFYERYLDDSKGKRVADEMNLGSSYHGTLMAQVLSNVIRESGVQADYDLYLFVTYGYTKFADAVDEVAKGGFDLVLYSQVWEYGGNGDGRGFINNLVKKALDSGVVWINAAGNFGRSMRVNKVDGKMEGASEYVVFTGAQSKGVQIECVPQGRDAKTCPLRLTLAWNDFKDDAETGTDKDLDLYLEKSAGERVGAGVKIQSAQKQKGNRHSLFPRELIEKDIPAGSYLARVQVMSKNFSASQDWLRLTASGLGVKMKDPTLGETILPPADLPGVIVVGAADDEESGQSKKWKKPDMRLKSSVRLSDGTNPRSSSMAAAVAAGVVSLHLGTMDEKSTEAVARRLQDLRGKSGRTVVAAAKPVKPAPGASEARAPCLPRAVISSSSGKVKTLLAEKNTVPVLYEGRTAILVNYDFASRMKLTASPGQKIFAGPDKIAVATSGRAAPAAGYYEVIRGHWVCR